MAGATVEITGESTVGDVIARDLARAKASLDELEKGGAGAGVAAGGIGDLFSAILGGLPEAASQIAGAIRAALDQIAALPPTQIKLSDAEAQASLHNVFVGATALAATNFEPVKITADNTDVFNKAKAVEQRLAQIQDKVVTITVNIVTSGSVPPITGGGGASATAEAHAAGTTSAPGGLTLVGERGPELVNLPRGSQVFDALDSRQMLAGKPGGDVYISALYITAPNNPSLADLLRQAQSARGG